MDHAEGSVADAISRLGIWLSREGVRMARVEYLSEAAREAVMAWLSSRVAVEDAPLPERREGSEVAGWMIESLRRAAAAPVRTVVCFRGFERAFAGPLPGELLALNLQRETFLEAGAAQIWWLPSEVVGVFLRSAPDLDSWFDLKLALTELPAAARLELVADRWTLAPEEGRRRSASLLARAERAIRAGEPWAEVWREFVAPALEDLRSAGLMQEAEGHAKRLGQLVRELRQEGIARPKTAADALALAEMLKDQGDLDRALDAAREALAGKPWERAAAGFLIARIFEVRGDLDEALRVLQTDVLPVFEKLGDIRSRAVTMGKIADIFQARGQFDEALRIVREELLPAFEKLGDIRERAVTMGRIADIFQARGQLDEALRIRREELLPVFEKLGAIRERAVTMGRIADIFQARGQLDEALRIRREDQLPVYEKLGDIRSRAVTLGKIADIFQARGQLEEALRIRREDELPVYQQLGAVHESEVTKAKIAAILSNLEERATMAEPLGAGLR